MEYKLPKAECLICNSYYTAKGMGRHIQSCIKKKFQDVVHRDAAYYALCVHPGATRDYFLYLLLPQNTTLGELDKFLRDIWLECCGHMSAFFYGRFNEISKDYSISDIDAIPGGIIYHYDFGSTTELHINIVGRYYGPIGLREKIVILSRNSEPVIPCDECGKKQAIAICAACQWDGGGWLCRQCAAKHGCEREMLLPVCNSPRSGVCGYTGEDMEINTDKALKDFLRQLKEAR
jgi:hypothetical protein